MTPLRFENRVVVVTGAARGLGRAYARDLAARGAIVVVNDRDGDLAREVADEIGGVASAADVATEAGARATIEHARTITGRIDAIVANAGTSWHREFGELRVDEFDEAMRDNFYTSLHVVRAAWPQLRSQRFGRVVMTASGGMFGVEGRAHYVAAKGAVFALSRALATEGKPDGVLVNCVLPWGHTRLARADSAAPPPEQAAPAVAWLCHPDCTVTGQVWTIGGHRVARVRLSLDPRS